MLNFKLKEFYKTYPSVKIITSTTNNDIVSIYSYIRLSYEKNIDNISVICLNGSLFIEDVHISENDVIKFIDGDASYWMCCNDSKYIYNKNNLQQNLVIGSVNDTIYDMHIYDTYREASYLDKKFKILEDDGSTYSKNFISLLDSIVKKINSVWKSNNKREYDKIKNIYMARFIGYQIDCFWCDTGFYPARGQSFMEDDDCHSKIVKEVSKLISEKDTIEIRYVKNGSSVLLYATSKVLFSSDEKYVELQKRLPCSKDDLFYAIDKYFKNDEDERNKWRLYYMMLFDN